MIVAVTGGKGFIGSAVVENLAGAGCEVRVIDLANDPGRRDSDRVQYCRADVCSPDIEKQLKGIDSVVHLAAYSKIKDCIKNPEVALDINIGGTLNVLLAAQSCGVRRVVFSSSASVYGNQPAPFRENLSARPLNHYGLTKLCGEWFCRVFTEHCGLETVVLRLFNVYGSEAAVKGLADCPSVVELFLRQRRLGQKLTVIGDGQQRRDLVHVTDVAAAFAAAVTHPSVGRGEIINIGSAISHSVSEIAGWVGGEIICVKERYPEARETLADVSLARKFLNWQPTLNLQSWIAETKMRTR